MCDSLDEGCCAFLKGFCGEFMRLYEGFSEVSCVVEDAEMEECCLGGGSR